MLTKEKLVEYLVGKYQPLAVILHGSRATDSNRPHSDWDVVLLTREQTKTQQEVLEGDGVDVDALTVDTDGEKILQEIGNAFHSAQVIFDTNDTGKSFVERVKKLAEKGYPIKPDEYISKKLFLGRLINRLVDSAECNPLVFSYHLGNFTVRSLNFWFQVNGHWSKSAYEAFEDIRKNNPELHKEYQVLISNISNTQKLESARAIYKIIFKESFENAT